MMLTGPGRYFRKIQGGWQEILFILKKVFQDTRDYQVIVKDISLVADNNKGKAKEIQSDQFS